MRLFDFRDEVIKLGISHSAIGEECAKQINNKSEL